MHLWCYASLVRCFFGALHPQCIREGIKKKVFLGDLSQMWVGGVADSQTRPKLLKTPRNHPENRNFWPEFHVLFSQISQSPWGGWVGSHIWGNFPQKIIFLRLPFNSLIVLNHLFHKSLFGSFFCVFRCSCIVSSTNLDIGYICSTSANIITIGSKTSAQIYNDFFFTNHKSN